MNSHSVIGLLAKKHAEDVFVPECKDGPSYGDGLLRLDAWAMKKSWANPLVTGYEVKVSRSDFNRDEKWRGYLGCCNEFYFVCPAGLLKPEEIPDPAGLLVSSENGTRLFRKKRAAYREVQIPESLYRYILFSRTKVTRERAVDDKRAFWEAWLQDEKIDRSFGWTVRGRIRKAIETKIEKVEQENKRLQEQHKTYEEVREFLRSIGIDPTQRHLFAFEAKNRLQELKEVIPRGLIARVRHGAESLEALHKTLKELEKSFSTGDEP